MSRTSIISVPPPPSSRLESVAARHFKRALAIPLRYVRKQSVRAAYQRGAASLLRDPPIEDAHPEIVETGRVLRQQVLATNRGKHAAAGYRVLMLNPGSITAEIWFGGLQSCTLKTRVA